MWQDINVAAQQTHLDHLQATVDNASPLPVHFSVSWNWDCCSCSSETYATRELLWPLNNGVTQSVLKHMVKIVDSVDSVDDSLNMKMYAGIFFTSNAIFLHTLTNGRYEALSWISYCCKNYMLIGLKSLIRIFSSIPKSIESKCQHCFRDWW